MQNKLKEYKEKHREFTSLKENYGIDENITEILGSYFIQSVTNMGLVTLIWVLLAVYIENVFVYIMSVSVLILVLIVIGVRLIIKGEAIYLRIYSLKVKDTTR